MVNFGAFLITWSLRSNSVTRQVNFYTTKTKKFKCDIWSNFQTIFQQFISQCWMRLFFCDFQTPCISVLNHKNVDDIGIFLSVSQISCKTIFRPCHQPLTLCTRVVLSTTIFHNHFWSPAVVAIERKQAEVTKIIFLDDSRGKRDVVKHRRSAQCLKITQNIAFSKTRQKWPFLAFLMNFCPLKM